MKTEQQNYDEEQREEDYYKWKELLFLEKIKERLKGYACGYHKELNKMLDNRIKELKKNNEKI